MSVRAYPFRMDFSKVIESFNLWHDNFFVELLDKVGGLDSLNDGSGITEINIEMLDEMKKLFEEKKDKFDLGEQTRVLEIFKQIEEDMKGERYINYYCL